MAADHAAKRMVLTGAIPLAADLRYCVIDLVRTGKRTNDAVNNDAVCWTLCSPDGNYITGIQRVPLSGTRFRLRATVVGLTATYSTLLLPPM